MEMRSRDQPVPLPNNPNSPNQELVAWRLCESHLRGIRTPTDSHSIASRSDESVKPTKLEARDRGINPLATNNPSSPNQDLVAWRLCESHLRGIRTPTDSHSIVSRSHESVKPTKLEVRDRGINPLATDRIGARRTHLARALRTKRSVVKPNWEFFRRLYLKAAPGSNHSDGATVLHNDRLGRVARRVCRIR
jgi:hypothetical protein